MLAGEPGRHRGRTELRAAPLPLSMVPVLFRLTIGASWYSKELGTRTRDAHSGALSSGDPERCTIKAKDAEKRSPVGGQKCPQVAGNFINPEQTGRGASPAPSAADARWRRAAGQPEAIPAFPAPARGGKHHLSHFKTETRRQHLNTRCTDQYFPSFK